MARLLQRLQRLLEGKTCRAMRESEEREIELERERHGVRKELAAREQERRELAQLLNVADHFARATSAARESLAVHGSRERERERERERKPEWERAKERESDEAWERVQGRRGKWESGSKQAMQKEWERYEWSVRDLP